VGVISCGKYSTADEVDIIADRERLTRDDVDVGNQVLLENLNMFDKVGDYQFDHKE
jgi:hypothetical protein